MNENKRRMMAMWVYGLAAVYVALMAAFYFGVYRIMGAGGGEAAQLLTYATLGDLQYNIIPMRTVLGLVKNIAVYPGAVLMLLLGQLAVWVPMGLFLPLLKGGLQSYRRVCLYILLVFIVVSVFPLLFRLGWFDIDFLILIFAGVSIGYALWSRLFAKKSKWASLTAE